MLKTISFFEFWEYLDMKYISFHLLIKSFQTNLIIDSFVYMFHYEIEIEMSWNDTVVIWQFEKISYEFVKLISVFKKRIKIIVLNINTSFSCSEIVFNSF